MNNAELREIIDDIKGDPARNFKYALETARTLALLEIARRLPDPDVGIPANYIKDPFSVTHWGGIKE